MLYNLEGKYNVEIKLYSFENINKLIKKYNIPKWRNTDIANARLFAHEFIKDVDKILYLDSDTIIADSLIDLLNKNCTLPISAVKELYIPKHMKDVVDIYYNSGVILFDYKLWENEDCTKLLCNCIKNNKLQLIYPDQDLLNISFYDMIDTLTADYNINPALYVLKKYPLLARHYHDKLIKLYSLEETDMALNSPHIFHMLNYLNSRPWIKNQIHPYNDIYRYYRFLWDQNFNLDQIDNIFLKMKFLPFLKVSANILLSEKQIEKVKSKIKLR